MAAAVLFPVAVLLVVCASAFLIALLLTPRWAAAIGAVFAAGEWFLAYRRSADRDDAREGLELVLFTGLFPLVLLVLWLLGIAAAVLWRRRRGPGRRP